jgi:hypothetical protein
MSNKFVLHLLADELGISEKDTKFFCEGLRNVAIKSLIVGNEFIVPDMFRIRLIDVEKKEVYRKRGNKAYPINSLPKKIKIYIHSGFKESIMSKLGSTDDSAADDFTDDS